MFVSALVIGQVSCFFGAAFTQYRMGQFAILMVCSLAYGLLALHHILGG